MKSINKKYDIAVIGGGPGGLTAALAAARHGAHVIIIEKNGYLGGLATSGLPLLGFLDKRGNQVVGGIAQELIDHLTKIGGAYGHNRCPLHNSVTIVDPDLFKIIAFQKCIEANIEILLHCEAIDVSLNNKKIDQITASGKGMKFNIEADTYIDATGDGDVAFLAGAAYEKGQKDTGVMQPPTVMFSLCNFNAENFYKYLEDHPEDLIPAETMHVSTGYDVPFLKSHPSHVFLGLRTLLKKLSNKGVNPLQRDTLIYINSTNPGQIYVNTTRILDFDGTDPRELTRGEIEGHFQIVELVSMLKRYVPGFEDCYISNINPAIGIRETRRIAGIQKLAIDNVLAGDIPSDTIALGSYKVDIHNGTDHTTILTDLERPYGIPLGCLVSKDINNLMISGRCISMDSQALASVRVMPTCMAIGEAAGVCAALALENKVLPAQLPAELVVEQLKLNNAILSI